MHKTIALTSFLLLFHLVSLKAQENLNDSNQDFTNWRVLFQMNGPNNWNAAINFVKPISNKWALRFGLSPVLSFNRSIQDNNDPQNYVSFEGKNRYRRLGMIFSFGGELHFLKKGKLDAYMIFGSGFGGFVEKNIRTNSYVLVNPRQDGLISFDSEENSIGTPRLSLNPFSGFGVNYFFHERFAFGLEYSVSPNMIFLKGNNKSERTETLRYSDGRVEMIEVISNNNTNSIFLDFTQQIGFHMIYVIQK